MTDHETFLLLAAKQVGEPLSDAEAVELDAHLATCPSCRSIATDMRRDDIRLRAELGTATVAPRVRRRVLDEASGRRHIDGRLILGLAAALLVASVGLPLFTGATFVAKASPAATTTSASLLPTTSIAPSVAAVPPTTGEAAATAPTPSPTAFGVFVAGAYTYGTTPRRDTIAAHFEPGPVGEWSRRMPATGNGDSFGGPVTCLVISGSDAWLAGPATTATDGTKDRAAMIYVHDGGRIGKGDAVVLWLTNAGQSLTTMTSWCQSRFVPAGPYPLSDGDVVVEDGQP